MPATIEPAIHEPAREADARAFAGAKRPVADERRLAPRVRRRLIANVVGLGVDRIGECLTNDISEGGLYVQAPSAAGLRVGQRCEVVLSDEPGIGDPSPVNGERRYATVIRTEPIQRGASTFVGAGLRFDQPLFL